MPGTNLTRAEASERAAIISTHRYDVTLDLTVGTERFASTTRICFDAVPGSSTFVDLVDAELDSIVLNDVEIDLASYQDSRIALTGLAESNELIVTGTCAYSNSGEGLHRFVDPVDERVYLYTQFEVPDARRVFATFEQPDLKASFTFRVTAPSHWKVISNSPSPEPVLIDEARAIWHFAPTKPMSTYITAIVAGEYHEIRDSYQGDYDEIPLGVFCRQSLVEFLDAEDIFEITKQGFGFFESAFEMAYPFGKYDQLFVPEYNMGAMENAGCVTFRDEMIFRSRQTVSAYEQRANTILHEMAHMWFGDLVTMRWWDDLWLNESFAEFAAHHSSVKATRFTEAWTGFTNNRKNWAYRQDQLPTTHPIAADNYDLHAVEANFDGITYAKGASALRQLVAWVGEDDFFAGLRSYFTKYAWKNTELTDLLTELEAASGRELTDWAAEWLQTSGVNTLRADYEVDADGVFTSFAIVQTAIPEYPTLRRHRIGVGLYSNLDGALVLSERIETDIAGERTDITELVGKHRGDLVLLNDGDLTYAKIRLDEHSLATLLDGSARLEDSLARALCWGSAWDMTRDAELSPSVFVDLVVNAVGTETDLTAVSALLRQANSAGMLFAADSKRDEVRARLATGVRELLLNAEPGSDHQLAFARALAASAQDPAPLREVLSGSVSGLAVDADLRWTIIGSLAALGAADAAEIAAELKLDDTNQGRENAAGALATRPTPEAKADAWRQVVEEASTPNETRRQVAAGFQIDGQAEVLAPYVERYLQMAETVVDRMGVWIGQIALIHLFPLVNPHADTLARVDEWLASTDAPQAAKRYVQEGRDDLARALRARAADQAR